MTREFLVVDLLNNLNLLAEDENDVKNALQERISNFDTKALSLMAERYGKIGTKKYINEMLDVSA